MTAVNLCRICLKESKPKKMKLLTEELLQRIEELSGIEIKLHTDYPKMICFQCVEMLDVASKFKTMCLSSENTLLGILIKPELKSEPQDFEDCEDFSTKSDNDGFFEEFIEAREVEDITEIADFAEDVELVNDGDEDTIQHTSSESESVVSLEVKEEKQQRRLKKTRTRGRRKQIVTKATVKPRKKSATGRRKKADDQAGNIMCEICGNIYKQRSLLNMHMRRHLEMKPFECEICGKTFACPSEIRRHMRTHTGEKPYVCKFCGRTFADRSTNIKHERIHTNERPFTCKTCGKNFTYSNVLKNHMLTHTGEKPFPCLACNKTFSRKHQLEQHRATLSHQQTVKCLNAAGAYISVDNDMNVETVNELIHVQEVQ